MILNLLAHSPSRLIETRYFMVNAERSLNSAFKREHKMLGSPYNSAFKKLKIRDPGFEHLAQNTESSRSRNAAVH